MLLIIEGADLVGKTVLAAAMVGEAARRGFTSLLMKAGPPRSSNAVDEYGMPLTAAKAEIESSETLVICDRWHLGELFYGPLLRGRSIRSEAATRLTSTACRLPPPKPRSSHPRRSLYAIAGISASCSTARCSVAGASDLKQQRG